MIFPSSGRGFKIPVLAAVLCVGSLAMAQTTAPTGGSEGKSGCGKAGMAVQPGAAASTGQAGHSGMTAQAGTGSAFTTSATR